MNNIFKFSIVTSFLGLWITTHVPENFELVLGFILIFTFGMIHGSNDLLIIKKYSTKNNITNELAKNCLIRCADKEKRVGNRIAAPIESNSELLP